MHDLHKKGLDRAIVFLKSIECQFKVVDSDGNIYTNMVESVRKKRRPRAYSHGELTAHIKKHIAGIEVGSIVTVPTDKFDAVSIARTTTSIMSATYGNGSYVSHKTDDGVEILRQH